MRFGTPGFLITDHGCQFLKAFHTGMERLGIRYVRCPIH